MQNIGGVACRRSEVANVTVAAIEQCQVQISLPIASLEPRLTVSLGSRLAYSML